MIRPIRPGRCFAAGLFGVLLSVAVLASEPLPVVGQPAASVDGLTLLLDPVDGTPIALLEGAVGRLPPQRRSLTLHGFRDETSSAGLPLLRVTDVLPEHWAEPAVWQPFRTGPAAYSGLGRELRMKDWAGRPLTDRRAYGLDNGLPSRRTSAAFSGPGVGTVGLSVGPSSISFSLTWTGVAGRLYAVEHTADLSRSFRVIRTLIAAEDRQLMVELPADGAAGFYRVVELPP